MKDQKPIWKTKTAKSDGDLTVKGPKSAARRGVWKCQSLPSPTATHQHFAGTAGRLAFGQPRVSTSPLSPRAQTGAGCGVRGERRRRQARHPG